MNLTQVRSGEHFLVMMLMTGLKNCFGCCLDQAASLIEDLHVKGCGEDARTVQDNALYLDSS